MRYFFLFWIGVFLIPTLALTQAPQIDIINSIQLETQDSAALISENITPEKIKKHLTILASDEMEGRETGTVGQRKAAEYIAGELRKLGYDPEVNDSYFQKILFSFSRWNELSLRVNDEKYRFMWDYYAFPSSNIHQELFEVNEVLFLGYGIDDKKYSDYKDVDVKGKVILIYQGEPLNKDSISYLTEERRYSDWALDWRKKLETAKRKGVKGIIFIESNVNKKVSRYRDRLLSGTWLMGDKAGQEENFPNSIYVSKDVAKEIIGQKNYKKFINARNKITKSGRPKSLTLKANIKMVMDKEQKIIEGENVLGFIEGSDEELKKEIVIVSAHYDHLGMRNKDIFNGADDNGSGTSTVLTLAETFQKAKKEGFGPRRSVLFLFVSGEEKGLLGSEFYVNNPVYPLERTVANVNVDMIGRVDKKHKKNPNYIYVIGADRLSTELHDINEYANTKYTQIELDYTYNEEDDPNRYYYRSDHYNFAELGIPAIFYFSGVHKDYHRASDTADKINYEKTAKIGKLIFHTIWRLSNQDKRIEVDVFPTAE